MTFTTLQYYVDTLRLLNRDDVSLNDKFQAFSDALGEDQMLQILKNVAKSASRNKTTISSLHDTLEYQITGTEMHCLNFPCNTNKSTFTGRTLSIKSILCHILSMVDIKSYSKCCSVNRQWFHDSFDCSFGNVLDLQTLQDLTYKLSRHIRGTDYPDEDYENAKDNMITKYLDRSTKCTTIRSTGYYDAEIYIELMDNWERFSNLESIDINITRMGSTLCQKLLNNISKKSENIRKLKIEHMKFAAYSSWSSRYHGTVTRLTNDEIDACFNNCHGFGKLEILKLTRIMPYVMIGNPKFGFGFGLVLKEVILDINEEHVQSFKKCLKYYEKEEMKFLNVFELIVRTGKTRIVNGGSIDGHLFDSKDLSRLAQFIFNVSKLKIHCPYINKFRLLGLLYKKAQFKPNLSELDIRLELVDNLAETRLQMRQKRMKERIKNDIDIDGAVDDVDVDVADVADDDLNQNDDQDVQVHVHGGDDEDDNIYESNNSSNDRGGNESDSDDDRNDSNNNNENNNNNDNNDNNNSNDNNNNNDNKEKEKVENSDGDNDSFDEMSHRRGFYAFDDDDDDEYFDDGMYHNGNFSDNNNNHNNRNGYSSNNNIGNDSDSDDGSSSSSDAFAQLIFAGEEKTFDDVNLSMIGLKNVNILIDKDWHLKHFGNIERIGEILHYAECIDIQIGDCAYYSCDDKDKYREYSDAVAKQTKYRPCHTILSNILHEYISVNTGSCHGNDGDGDGLRSNKLISSNAQCIRASVACTSKSGTPEQIIQLLNDFANIDEMRKHGVSINSNECENEKENEIKCIKRMPLFVDLNFYMNERMKFSQLCNDIPKIMKLLKHLIENCLVNIDIHLNHATPDDIFDCYKDELLQGLNKMKNSKVLFGDKNDDSDNHVDNFGRFKYYKVENEATVTLDHSWLRLINATKVKNFN